MSNFQDQDWQVVFSKAAFQMQIPFQVELVESVDAEFIEKSSVSTFLITNLEVHKTHLGADAYFAKPMLERILKQHGMAELGQTLQFTRPQVLPASSSESVLNVALRFAFVFKDSSFEEVEEETETEAERIAREEEEEFQRLLEEEEAEKEAEAQRQREAQELADKEATEKAEKERLEKEQEEREAEAQRLKDAEDAQAQQNEQSNQEQTQNDNGDDEFPEETR